jgi:hypothetical protein
MAAAGRAPRTHVYTPVRRQHVRRVLEAALLMQPPRQQHRIQQQARRG